MADFFKNNKGDKNVDYEGYTFLGDSKLKVSDFSKVSLKVATGNTINQVAIDTFNRVSRYGYDKMLVANPTTESVKLDKLRTQVSEYITYFLYGLGIVSSHEGNLRSINTYDKGGLSVGTIQLANPSDGFPLMKFLKVLDIGIYNRVKEGFSQGSDKNDYSDPKSLKTRVDLDLLKDLYALLGTSKGWASQFEIIITEYFDPAFDVFLKVVKPKLYVGPGEGPLFVYASAFCFETNVQASGRLAKINNTNMNEFLKIAGNKPTEGHFCFYFANKVIDLATKTRDSDWNGINSAGPLMTNFKMQP